MKMRKGLTRLAIFALAATFVSCSHVQEAAKGGKREIASMNACGLTGSIKDRIRDCSYQDSSASGSFALVTRTKEFKDVYIDTKSGILWGDRLPSTMNHYDALKACKANLPEMGGMSSLTWRLPSVEEYKEAETNGIRSALPNMSFWLWSSKVNSDRDHYGEDLASLFNGSNGSIGDDFRNDNSNSVRCVAR